MSDPTEGTWPEQNAVDAWIKKYEISATHKELMELKNAVTKVRLDFQKQVGNLEAENAQLKKDKDILQMQMQWHCNDCSPLHGIQCDEHQGYAQQELLKNARSINLTDLTQSIGVDDG